MRIIKKLLIFCVSIFFKIYFLLFGKATVNRRMEKTVELYSGLGFGKWFVPIRLWDAPFNEIEKLVPKKGIIIDLGSGDGLLGNYLAISSKERKITGVEINKQRIKNIPKGPTNAVFKYGNILKDNFSKADGITLIHVLHHLNSFEEQVKMIEKCKTGLNTGGKIVIAEIIERPFLKFLFTGLTDYFILPILFENRLISKRIYYRSLEGWKMLLRDCGFSVKTKVVHKGMPFSHAIFEAELK